MDLFTWFTNILFYVVEFGTFLFEFIGVGILLSSGVKTLISYIRRNKTVDTQLAKGLSTGLEFLLGGEVLHTILVRDIKELAMIGGLILLRGLLTLFIHWDIKSAREKYELDTRISND
ncbi:MAG: DUF1622 domain-containing protein [Clostridiales bacterium]|nr:DUF1622 domain-containing protein [Clostridiales bacterium]